MAANPVEPDLALHQSLPEPAPEPSSEPCWTWLGSAPKHPTPSPAESCWTWPGSAPKPPRPSPEPSEPSPEPRWTSPGACTSAHRSYSELFWAINLRCWGKQLPQNFWNKAAENLMYLKLIGAEISIAVSFLGMDCFAICDWMDCFAICDCSILQPITMQWCQIQPFGKATKMQL